MLVWCLLLLQLDSFSSYTIDTDSASVIYHTQNKSLFGYSVAIHKTSDKYIYLVGAPRANTTQDLASPGAIYGCDVVLSETKQVTRCNNWLKVFDSADDRTVTVPNIQGKEEILRAETKSNQYFGISLIRTDNSVIGCAHLYKDHYEKKRYKKRLPIGRCTSVDGELSKVTSNLAPCLDVADTHDSYGSCLSGASVATHGGTVMVSAPNANNGLGNSFFYSKGENTTKEDILELVSSEWVTQGQEDVEYAGYSSVFCDINGDGIKEMILGMPRSKDYKGSIKIHYGSRKQQSEDPFPSEEVPGVGRIDTKEYKNLKVLCPTPDGFCGVPAGDIIGSYFGHTLACADLDNDGVEDLIVSSPYFSHDHRNEWLVDRGKVTIYFGSYTPNDTLPNIVGPTARKLDIFGEAVAGGSFGYSLHAGSDLNSDGIHDLIVGAPHEKSEGAVYLFNGGKGAFDSQYSQKITPTDIKEKLETFGSSLSSGLNVDGRGGDDILVGAYRSAAVVGLRSVAIVNIVPTLILLHDVVNLENTTFVDPLTGDETVGNTLRINISTKGIEFPVTNVKLYWKLKLDPLMSDNIDKRAYFKITSNSPPSYELDGITNLQSNTTETLPDIINILLKRRTIKSVKNLFVDIEGEIKPAGTFSSKYVLRHEMFGAARAEIHISTNCDKDTGLCSSDLELAPPNVTYSEGFKYIVKTFVKFVYLDYSVTNRGPKAAYSAGLNVTIPTQLSFITTPSSQFTCVPLEHNGRTDVVGCMFKEPLYRETKNIMIKFAINQTRLVPNTYISMIATLGVDHPSNDPLSTNNVQMTRLKVMVLAELNLYGGPLIKKQMFDNYRYFATNPNTVKDIGPLVRHIIEIRMVELSKIADISNITLEIKWPLKTKKGTYALYMTDIRVAELYKDNIECSKEFVDVLNIIEQNILTKRSVQTKKSSEEEAIFSFGGGDEQSVDCSNTNCVVIKCKVTRLERGSNDKSLVRLEIQSRLWESSFTKSNYLNISSVVKITSVGGDLVLPSEEQITKVLTSQFYVPNKKKAVPLLTILLAALAGLFLLLLLILILWKIGFFRRRTPSHLVFTGSKSETFTRGKIYSST